MPLQVKNSCFSGEGYPSTQSIRPYPTALSRTTPSRSAPASPRIPSRMTPLTPYCPDPFALTQMPSVTAARRLQLPRMSSDNNLCARPGPSCPQSLFVREVYRCFFSRGRGLVTVSSSNARVTWVRCKVRPPLQPRRCKQKLDEEAHTPQFAYTKRHTQTAAWQLQRRRHSVTNAQSRPTHREVEPGFSNGRPTFL